MLQRLSKGAHRSHSDSSSLPSRQSDFSTLDIPSPPLIGKVDHHSIELYWPKLHDSAKGDKRIKYSIEEENSKTHEYSTVYLGYADFYKVEGLYPLHAYKYRLKIISKDGIIVTSPAISVCTKNEPLNSEHLHRATSKRDVEAILKIIATGEVSIEVTDKMGYTPLMNAAQKGYLEVVDALINAKANINAQNSSGKNSLMLACFAGNEAVVRRLREAGATWDCADKGGSTPLHWAVDGKNSGLVKWMIEDGAKIDVKDHLSGWTPLIRCAAMGGEADVARVLLNAGACVDITDFDGKTALMIASLNGHLNMVKILVEYGADVMLKSGHHKTALDMAQSFTRSSVVEYLDVIHQDLHEKALEERRASYAADI